MTPSLLLFWILAVVSVGASLLMIFNSNPIRSALSLVASFLCVAMLYLTLSAQFLAFVQVIVYAGAIMVLFLFVVMLLNPGAPQIPSQKGSLQPAVAVGTASVMLLTFFLAGVLNLTRSNVSAAAVRSMGTVENVGKSLYSPTQPWMFPFELTSVLLLTAVVGAIVMTKRKT